MKRINLELLVMLILLIGTLYIGAYTMYQINTTDFKGIIQSGMNK